QRAGVKDSLAPFPTLGFAGQETVSLSENTPRPYSRATQITESFGEGQRENYPRPLHKADCWPCCCNASATQSSSWPGVNISSARTTKRFPSPRCASTIQIVCPLESIDPFDLSVGRNSYAVQERLGKGLEI